MTKANGRAKISMLLGPVIINRIRVEIGIIKKEGFEIHIIEINFS